MVVVVCRLASAFEAPRSKQWLQSHAQATLAHARQTDTVAMDCLAGTAALGATGVYRYNRDNFFYDRKLRLKAELKLQDFRISQARPLANLSRRPVMRSQIEGFSVLSIWEGHTSGALPSSRLRATSAFHRQRPCARVPPSHP